MPTLREIAEQLKAEKQHKEAPSDSHLQRVLRMLGETALVQRAVDAFGDDLLAITVVPHEAAPAQEGDDTEASAKVKWLLLFVTTNIEITEHAVTDFQRGPSIFTPNGPLRSLALDYALEEARLLGEPHVDEDEVRRLYTQLERVLQRWDLPDSLRLTFENILAQSGLDEGAYTCAKLAEIRDRQRAVDPRDLRYELKERLRDRQIAIRQEKLDQLIAYLKEERAGEIMALGGLEVWMVHLESLRRMIFVRKDSQFVDHLTRGRLYDRGMLIRLAGALTHMQQVTAKFEHYIVGYALCGSWITHGHASGPNSDIDIIVVVDDIDVQKMGRVELSQKVATIIQQQGVAAANAVGLPANALHSTTFLLTEAIKGLYEGNVVLYSMLDKAFVLSDPKSYLRSWQVLLHEGGIAPSYAYAERLLESSRTDIFYPSRRIRDAIVEDLYPGVLAGAQSLLLRMGERVLPPVAVVARLQSEELPTDETVSREGLLQIASVLEQLLELYRGYKKRPFMHVPAAHLGELMAAAEAVFAFMDRACHALQAGRMGQVRALPVTQCVALAEMGGVETDA